MAKTEAFCTKCGSLINIDDTKNNNKCIFCGTEVETSKALELTSDTEKRVAIQKEAETKEKELAKLKKDSQKGNKPAKAEPVAPVVKEIIVLKPLPLKTKLILIGCLVGFVAILAGIFVPTILSRNEKRTNLSSQLNSKIPFAIKSYSYKFNDNREFLVATDVEITEEKARNTYDAYVDMYKTVYSVSLKSAQDKIAVKVYGKNGLFLCKQTNGAFSITFVTATPTPSPVPTKSIVNP